MCTRTWNILVCSLPADEVKLNAWEAPTQVAKWKEEHVSHK